MNFINYCCNNEKKLKRLTLRISTRECTCNNEKKLKQPVNIVEETPSEDRNNEKKLKQMYIMILILAVM